MPEAILVDSLTTATAPTSARRSGRVRKRARENEKDSQDDDPRRFSTKRRWKTRILNRGLFTPEP